MTMFGGKRKKRAGGSGGSSGNGRACDDYKKLVIVGDGCCGKTSLLVRFTRNEFPRGYVPTVFDTELATVHVNGEQLRLSLWDTAGQEAYDRLRPLSYSDSDVVLIAYSVADRDTMANVVEKWYPEVCTYVPHVPILLVATKIDLRPTARLMCAYPPAAVTAPATVADPPACPPAVPPRPSPIYRSEPFDSRVLDHRVGNSSSSSGNAGGVGASSYCGHPHNAYNQRSPGTTAQQRDALLSPGAAFNAGCGTTQSNANRDALLSTSIDHHLHDYHHYQQHHQHHFSATRYEHPRYQNGQSIAGLNQTIIAPASPLSSSQASQLTAATSSSRNLPVTTFSAHQEASSWCAGNDRPAEADFVSYDEGRRLAGYLGAAGFVECSALADIGVNEVFYQAALLSLRPQRGYGSDRKRRLRCNLL